MENINKEKITKISYNENLNKINNQSKYITQLSNSNIINEKSEIIIINKISDLLSNICDENTKTIDNEKNPFIKPFLSKIIPQISIKDYLERLYKYSRINSSTIILILIYIDRICNIHKFKLTYFIIHKLILASLIIAIKYNEDEYYSTKFYAKLGGVSKSEMIFLEFNFISLIKFNLFVKNELFNKYNDYISSADSDEDVEEDIEENDNSNNDESRNGNKDNNNINENMDYNNNNINNNK